MRYNQFTKLPTTHFKCLATATTTLTSPAASASTRSSSPATSSATSTPATKTKDTPSDTTSHVTKAEPTARNLLTTAAIPTKEITTTRTAIASRRAAATNRDSNIAMMGTTTTATRDLPIQTTKNMCRHTRNTQAHLVTLKTVLKPTVIRSLPTVATKNR